MATTKGRKWKPGQAERFRKTMAAKRRAKVKAAKPPTNGKEVSGVNHRDAILYLQSADRYINQSERNGRIKKPDRAHRLSMLALSILEGD